MSTRQSNGRDCEADEAARLLEWFERSGRKLPWRTAVRDPYLTLISETMLQQTQVQRVVPFFERFVSRFPSFEALASASVDEVLGVWSGLGYYRRARLLHSLAERVVSEHEGCLPADQAGLKGLPGIGPYTAAAVGSLVYGTAEPVVDGNVRRVAARRLPIWGDVRTAAATRQIRAWILALMGHAPPGCVNEALMEVGARVCDAKRPLCDACPLSAQCSAHRDDLVAELPEPRPSSRVERLSWVFACCVTPEGEWMLRRITDGPILRGLWLPPFAELRRADETTVQQAAALVPHSVGNGEVCRSMSHSITFRRIELIPVRFAVMGRELPAATWQYARPDKLRTGTSSLLPKLVKSVE